MSASHRGGLCLQARRVDGGREAKPPLRFDGLLKCVGKL